jgi:kynurenine 3-monooxygenase
VRDELRGRDLELPMRPLLAADGAGSRVRDAMVATGRVTTREDLLAHRYKELDVPAVGGRHALTREALHIWPRGGYMLIALPNTDGSFTATLFMAAAGDFPSFATLDSAAAVRRLFAAQFADLEPLIPDLCEQFLANPTGTMTTVHAAPWHIDAQALLLGDAAHAIVPFHGQGMNAAFEDCVLFDDLLSRTEDWATLFAGFEAERRPNTAAIAELALENYIEMRDTVREPTFQLQKAVALELERRLPRHFIPQYSMVMFHAEIPYAVAQRRGRLQAALLREITRDRDQLQDIDLVAAEQLVLARLEPLPPPAQALRASVTKV